MRRGLALFLVALWLATLSAAAIAADAPSDPVPGGDAAVGRLTFAGPLPIEAPAAEQSAVKCPSNGDTTVAEAPMVHVQRALQPGDRLDILAVGSATVLGPDAAHPEAGFPYRMAQALKLAAPQSEVTLTLRGGKGLTASAMLDAIGSALGANAYQLVIWQTGTVEAVRGMPPDALYGSIVKGVELLREHSDLILVDPQFSRFLRANKNLEPYEAAVRQGAALPGVTLFQRFALMRDWADRGSIDLERASAEERPVTAERLHICLGRALAKLVLAGAGLHASK